MGASATIAAVAATTAAPNWARSAGAVKRNRRTSRSSLKVSHMASSTSDGTGRPAS